MPDTWMDALLRPIAMVAPDAAVYVEFMAPDLRFAFILLLLLTWVVMGWRKKWKLSATTMLFGFVALSFVSWLATSGNGRYFMPILLVAGPLCIALIYHLPIARNRKLVIAILALSLQGFVVYEADPFWHQRAGAWAEEPFFEISPDLQMLEKDTTYITFTGLSYSLMAPKFDPSSRWINLSSLADARAETSQGRQIQGILAASKKLKLIFPSLPGFMTSQNLISEDLKREINRIFAPQRLGLTQPESCKLIGSKGLARRERGNLEKLSTADVDSVGFWACSLDYPVAMTVETPIIDAKVEKVFERLEGDCPRLFTQGRSSSPTSGGYLRFYPDSDMRVYVLDNGIVYYKHWRVMNPVQVGTINEILGEKFKMDCNSIRGRSGLPWDRQL